MASETTADICAEMRTEAARADMEQGYSIDDAAEAMREFAWRIEAAHKREVGVSKTETTTKENLGVVNAAKMREVLKSASERLRKATESEKFGEDVLYLVGCMRSVAQELDHALAEPPRNCERFNNSSDAWIAWDEEFTHTPQDDDNFVDFGDWLFAEAKGETDENK